MRVEAIETVVVEPPVENVLPGDVPPAAFVLVQVFTDQGIVGLGQTAQPRTADVIHDLANRFILGEDPLQVERRWHDMFDHCAYHGYSGAEARAISAIDIALWDIRGQRFEVPIYELLGGAMTERIGIYNTCSAYGGRSDKGLARTDPSRLVDELLESDIHCLKWNAFDVYAGKTAGQYISRADLRDGVRHIEALAKAGGNDMEIMVEGHAKWSITAAVEIARGLDGLPIRWLEDMVWGDHPSSGVELRSKSPFAIAAGERLMSRHQVLPLVQAGGVDVLISDVTWAGGLTEVKKIGDLASTFGVPLALHDHSGPVNIWASAHALLNASNPYLMETTRVFYEGYYDGLVVGEQIIRNGHLHLPSGPGLGIRLRADAIERFGTSRRRSELAR